jgi:transcriptional regulator with XRE-family HTH domain
VNSLIAPAPPPPWHVLPIAFGDCALATLDRVGPAANQQLVGLALTRANFGELERLGQTSATARIVRGLRDDVRRATGLSRQGIARIIGVDRRSLSGWSNGSVEPTDENLDRLRRLARLVSTLDLEAPGSARWVLDSREPLEAVDIVRAIRQDDLDSVVRALRAHSALAAVGVAPIMQVPVPQPTPLAERDWDDFADSLETTPLVIPAIDSSQDRDEASPETPFVSRWAKRRGRRGAANPEIADS